MKTTRKVEIFSKSRYLNLWYQVWSTLLYTNIDLENPQSIHRFPYTKPMEFHGFWALGPPRLLSNNYVPRPVFPKGFPTKISHDLPGNCPILGILDITWKSSHLVDQKYLMVGCSMGTFDDPWPMSHFSRASVKFWCHRRCSSCPG